MAHSSHLTKFKLFEVRLKSGSIPCFFLILQRYVLRLLEFLVLIYYIFCGNLGYLFHKIHIFSGSVNTNTRSTASASTCVRLKRYIFLVESLCSGGGDLEIIIVDTGDINICMNLQVV